jgi:hypothetical protein
MCSEIDARVGTAKGVGYLRITRTNNKNLTRHIVASVYRSFCVVSGTRQL